ncbi:MAG TPA: LysR family transcriptional regulator [Burkholderiales bacterium]|nr:LysR family transcriptional regulator [Burkholderiales bacterium]
MHGRIWLTRHGRNFLGRGRVELLEHIGETGSISKAAKLMKMSYKSAWDAVDAMNRNAGFPLVECASGGKDGGGSSLTNKALELIALYKKIESEHEGFLARMNEEINSLPF